jgi:hypothetical protein
MKRTLCLAGATLAKLMVALILGTLGVRAEVPFSVSIERPERTLDVVAFTTFEIHVMNEGSDTLRVRAIRAQNDLPDSAWETSICSINTCYPPEIDTTEYERAAQGAMTGFSVHVMTGARYGDTATIVVHVDSGPGTDSVVRTLKVATARPAVQLFRVEPAELEQSIAVGQTAEFLLYAINQSSDTLALSIVRYEDFFTGPGWESSLCVEETCYPADVDSPPAVVVSNDKATYFRIRVHAGSPGKGDVVVRINTGRGTEPIEKRLTVNAGVAGAELPRMETVGSAVGFPNPTTGRFTVTLPSGFRATESTHVELVDVSGRTIDENIPHKVVEAVGASIRLDLTNYPTGHYLVRVGDSETSVVLPVILSE